MYQTLLPYHSYLRWLILAALLLAIYKGYKGYTSGSAFTKTDNRIRHWTATFAHIQLVIGIIIYSQSATVKYFWSHPEDALYDMNQLFFALIHLILMFVSILLITIGSALAKRRKTDREKFKTMLIWFSIALLLIFIAIPWPFSPLANRPYWR